MTKDEKSIYIDEIVGEIFALNDPAIDPLLKKEVSDTVTGVINGDNPVKHFVINIDERAVIYILTEARVIKVEIENSKIHRLIFALSDITRVEGETIPGENKMISKVIFQDASLGLFYPMNDQKARDFFQTLDELRIRRK